MDPVFPDEESPQGFAPLEPEQFLPVPGNDRLRPDGTVGIEVSAHEPVHVRVHASVGGNAPHQGPVPVQVDPDRSVHGAGILLPGVSVREADGGQIDVLSGRQAVIAGRMRPVMAGKGFMGTSGGSEKQGIPGAGRREEGQADDSDGSAHSLFFSKLAQENKKQHKPMPTCVVSGGILSVSYRPRENRRPASKSILTGWIVRRERGWPQSK
jgi:hypothetical protein